MKDRKRSSPSPGTLRLEGCAWGILLAWTSCLGIYAVATQGAAIRVVTGWAPTGADLSILEIVATCLVTIGLGTLLLGALERWTSRAMEAWTVIALVVAVLSAVPLWGLPVDTHSKLALTAMHLATGVAAILGHAFARGRRRSQAASSASLREAPCSE